MPAQSFSFKNPISLVAGSFGDSQTIASETPDSLRQQCDIAEIRLDLIFPEFEAKGSNLWKHLHPFPLLFTARCHSEGSPFDFNTGERAEMLKAAIADAALIDIEAKNASSMTSVISAANAAGVPWIASYHDFDQLPSRQKLETHAEIAREAGAAAFKCAAKLRTMDDLTALAHFQISEHSIPVATMGMGVLAPVSRLLCAQAGSVLNYGYVGKTETAPGQWSAKQLRDCIHSLHPFH
ncbi:type I 3-dehydroquinate dehydratase [Luteolibacter algae]|uniref:3-dehydroquinate dehydratase n=1 Tax=Luteolibacter algae TaxID=454151 RepID=A0ABW5DAS8_9BACT